MAASPIRDEGAVRHQFLAFQLAGRRYAVPIGEVEEVIRLPAVARVPQAPQGLLGLANLRGAVIPVASGRGLLGTPQGEATDRSRAIILDGHAPVALAVDSIDALIDVSVDAIEANAAEIATLPGEVLRGAFPAAEGAVKILDIQGLMASAFTPRPRKAMSSGHASASALQSLASEQLKRLLTFSVAGQEYALPLEGVQEVVSMPNATTDIPNSESIVRGVIGFRGGLLPLLSLRQLLGIGLNEVGAAEKIVVTRVAGELIGLVADKLTGLLAAPESKIEDIPEILAARSGGESRIRSIYRGDAGRRLVPILSSDGLFGDEVMRKLEAARHSSVAAAPQEAAVDSLQFVVFRLGADEFGLPIAAVEEVIRLPDKITRVPKTPKFLEGVVNLRGDVLPVIDQRRRFGMPATADLGGRRLVVVRTDRLRAGIIVDSVSDVLRVRSGEIGDAPALAGEATALIQGVANLEAAGRIILLLDPTEVLTRAEQGLLDKFVGYAESLGK